MKRLAAAIQFATNRHADQFDKGGVKSDAIARIVKMADLRHNSDLRRLKGVTEKDVARVAKYMQFYQELKEISA